MAKKLTNKWSVNLGFSIDPNLTSNLEYFRNDVLYNDFDCVGCIDGREGAGKSVLAQQVAVFLDKDHTIDLNTQLVFTPSKFKEACLTMSKGKCIIWDEARSGLNKRRTMSEINNTITDMLAEIRQRNLFILVVMPTFYDMDRNVAIWRSEFLIHVYKVRDKVKKMSRRGQFKFYSESGKRELYQTEKYSTYYRYPFLSGKCFQGRFIKHYVVPEKEYRQRKYKALRAYQSKAAKEAQKKAATACPDCGKQAVRVRKKDGMAVCRMGHSFKVKKT